MAKKFLGVGTLVLALSFMPTYALFAQEQVILVLLRERTVLQEQAAVIQGLIVRAEERGLTGFVETVSHQRIAAGLTDNNGHTLSSLRSDLERRNTRIEQLNTEIALMMQVMQNQSVLNQQGQIFN